MRAKEILPRRALAEVDTIAPVKPLTPEQSRKRAAKQAKVQAQVKDEDHRHAAKERDLKARLT
jgi:hypothetical protein